MGKMVYVDLTHPFSAEIPRWPYFDKPVTVIADTTAMSEPHEIEYTLTFDSSSVK